MISINEKIVLFITLIFSISLIFSVLIVPSIHRTGIKLNLIDKVDIRKVHKGKIVRLGGLGIFFGYLIGTIVIYLVGNHFGLEFSKYSLILVGSFIFLLIGFLDDLYSLSPFLRLALQFLTTIILFSYGLKIDAIDISWINPNLNPIFLNNSLSLIFISVWVVGLTNAINWIDGLDALASGICLIATLSLIFILVSLQKWELVFLSTSFCGGIIGFLRYNFFPAKIMMGDSGSYFLGSFLSILSLVGLPQEIKNLSLQSENLNENISIFPFHIALLIFFIPICDMCYVIFNRVRKGHSPFFPDRSHIHHKLLTSGLNERGTTVILYTISLLFSCIAISIFGIEGKIYYLSITFISLLLSILYVVKMKLYLE